VNCRKATNAIWPMSACLQVTSNVVLAVAPASTDTDRGSSAPTPQLARTSASSISWLPVERPGNVCVSLVPMGVACPPSRVSV
jgi:hypothetical protein